MHELAAHQNDSAGAYLELVQGGPVAVTVIRCPTCKGLRTCYPRHEKRQSGKCLECKQGNVVLHEQFFGFWLERYTNSEIREMAVAIWGEPY